MKIRTGDTVLVTTGKDKGKTGQVLRTLVDTGKVVVAGVNMRTRHIRKTPQQAGQILRYEAALDASNVQIVDPKSGKPTRIGHKIDEKTGKKTRIAKKSGVEIAKAATAKPKKAETKTTQKGKKSDAKPDSKTSSESQATGGQPDKKPFWKKMGFGADEAPHGEDPTAESTPGADSAAHPTTEKVTHRSGSRGS